MFDEYKKRLLLYGRNAHEALMTSNEEIMEYAFADMTTYKRVKVDGTYYDARFLEDRKDTVESAAGNHRIQFRKGVHFPVGTYIEIPNEEEVYEKWLLVSDVDAVQFPKNCILKCNYNLKWIYNNRLIEYPVALRTKNSYTDGVKQAEEFNTLDNQAAFWIPFNEDTQEITYDMRFLISNNPKHPKAFKVTKVDDVLRPGLVMVFLLQDQLQDGDDGNVMCANYDRLNGETYINILNIGDSLSIRPQDEVQLEVEAVINGRKVQPDEIVYASEHPDIVMVSKTGNIKGIAPGKSVVKASCGDKSDSIAVEVAETTSVQNNISVIDPDGDYVIRLYFDKQLKVVTYIEGIKTEGVDYQYEVTTGSELIEDIRFEDEILTIVPVNSISNIGKSVQVTLINEQYGLKTTVDLKIGGLM